MQAYNNKEYGWNGRAEHSNTIFPLTSIKRRDRLVETVEMGGDEGDSGHFRTCHQQTTGLPRLS
jgi:hypothetical protein